MRKDLIFRYLNSALSNLSRIQLHLLDQDNQENQGLKQEDNRIAKESHPALSEIELSFIVSQLDSIIESAHFTKTKIEESDN